MRKLFVLILIVTTLAISCTKSFDVGQTATVKASNSWWVTYNSGGDLVGTVFLSTYNASANTTDSLWIDDLGQGPSAAGYPGFFSFKSLVGLDYSALTFGNPQFIHTVTPFPDDFPDSVVQDTMRFFNGKILPKAGHSKTGVVTDSIYFQYTWSADPYSGPYGDTVTVAGTARTGFIDDDY